ncbi:MAG: DegV family protein [Chloroflexi bacterium]|nr:DegV family protein [Chloroflexota bacterium]
MGVRIITDTSCDLPPHLEDELRELGVVIVPFLFFFGLEECTDKSISMQEFLVRAEKVWPTTSVPSTGSFVKAFRDCVEAGDQVVCMTITSNHSATFSAAMSASQQFAPGQVTVLDSRSLSVGQGLLVLAAARAASEGRSPEEIVQAVDELRQRLHVFIALDTVEYLVRGGRASRLSGVMAGLLRIRPILTLLDGELTLLDRSRGRKAAKQKLIDLANGCLPAATLGVAHIACEEEAKGFVSEIASQTGFPEEAIFLAETGMIIATHGGPGTLGIVVVSEPNP